jgi:S-adenosyl-L-methionine hydrolase (adenosine-forming)
VPSAILPITFLSDYGHEDDFVGVCHGVIQRIAPGAVVIDVAHALPPHDTLTAALVLRNTLPYMPKGVHLAIVDPGVGTERRAVALRSAEGHLFVGPDNGLLSLAFKQAGGVDAAVDLSESAYRLERVSATFHGRDVFAPVAAQLAMGTALDEVGAAFPPEELTALELPEVQVSAGQVKTRSIYIDRFGNIQLNATAADMHEAGLDPGSNLRIEARGKPYEASYARTFADAPKLALLVYVDSYEAIALAVNGGSAAAALSLSKGAPVTLRRMDG